MIRGTVEVAEDGLSFTAPYTLEVVAPDGTRSGEHGVTTARGIRITIEDMGEPVGTLDELAGATAPRPRRSSSLRVAEEQRPSRSQGKPGSERRSSATRDSHVSDIVDASCSHASDRSFHGAHYVSEASTTTRRENLSADQERGTLPSGCGGRQGTTAPLLLFLILRHWRTRPPSHPGGPATSTSRRCGRWSAPSPPPRGDPSGLAGGVRASDRRGTRLGLRLRRRDVPSVW